MKCKAMPNIQGGFTCEVCGFSYRVDFRRECPKDRTPEPTLIENLLALGAVTYLRPRTAEEAKQVKEDHCQKCRAYFRGMCLDLVAKGCNSCKNAADFDVKLELGIGCERGLFPSTARVEPIDEAWRGDDKVVKS